MPVDFSAITSQLDSDTFDTIVSSILYVALAWSCVELAWRGADFVFEELRGYREYKRQLREDIEYFFDRYQRRWGDDQ